MRLQQRSVVRERNRRRTAAERTAQCFRRAARDGSEEAYRARDKEKAICKETMPRTLRRKPCRVLRSNS